MSVEHNAATTESPALTQKAGASLKVHDVTMRFSGVTVLDSVSFEVEPGTVHAIIGPNGAGKSTLFNVLSGIYKPSAGSVLLNDTPLIGLRPDKTVRAGVGRAFQNASMFNSMTVEENLLLGRHHLTKANVLSIGFRLPRASREEQESRDKIRAIADFVGISDLLARDASSLPYGEAKRVDLTRALATEPTLLLLDEPAAGMHTHEKTEMRDLIVRISRELGVTILLVEHDMGLVMGASDRITVLNFGTVITTDSPEAIRNDPRVIEAYLGHSSARDQVNRTDDTPSDSTTPGDPNHPSHLDTTEEA